MRAFAGARTHATIAAISSCVPTLSLAYSRKARGLNQDVFGSQEYCVQPSEITPGGIAERMANLLANGDAIPPIWPMHAGNPAGGMEGGNDASTIDREPMTVSVIIPLYNKARYIRRR